jgi:hypothetical protein
VEIKTGQKSVMDYLLKPLNKVKESMRERWYIDPAFNSACFITVIN